MTPVGEKHTFEFFCVLKQLQNVDATREIQIADIAPSGPGQNGIAA